jgi:hypothetical protein
MDNDDGHPLRDGLSSSDGAVNVSTLRASIPDADLRAEWDALSAADVAVWAEIYVPVMLAEMERLREALRPFADLATGEVADSKDDSAVFFLMDGHKRYAAVSMKDLRRAKAMETGTAKTEGLGAKHDSAAPQGVCTEQTS